jgi:tRNA dimethylallyltransferase
MAYTERHMKPLVVILGPTATGKSSLAMTLAQKHGGEIVNADALQVYRGLEIGTAKPSCYDREQIPHHLVDILEPTETFSAGEFARQARIAIKEIRKRQRIPIVVGGSGLYCRALLDGLSPIPPIPQEIRRQLRNRLEREGLAALRQELRGIDPEVERDLAAGDKQRILRALEVWLGTSRTLTSWRQFRSSEEPLSATKIGLTLPRTVLYDRIAQRATAMIDAGWVQEVKTLLEGGLSGSEPAFQAIGYRQLVEHVRRGSPLSETLEMIVVATRRYAKRQQTWFRREPGIRWFEALEFESLVGQVEQEFGSVLCLGGQG